MENINIILKQRWLTISELDSYKDVWVFAEIKDHERVHDCVLEILGKARELANELGQKLVAILLSLEAEKYIPTIEEHGADKVIYISNPNLKHYHERIFTDLVYNLILKHKPSIFLFPSTDVSNALAARLAYRCHTGLVSNVLNLELVNQNGANLLISDKPAYLGNIIVKITCPETRPQMCTITVGTFQKKKIINSNFESEEVEYDFDPSKIRIKIIGSPIRKDKPSATLSDAKFVIGGGHGLISKENFDKTFQLARYTKGQVGGTRRPIMDGWMPEHLQIGISGETIVPELYLSFGISGAIQHIVGVTNSKTIVAINKDPNAPIFKVSDYCVIVDAPKILECLLKYYRE